MTKIILEQALQLHLSGKLKEAKLLYKQCITMGANDPAAYANLGVILNQEGNLDEALKATLKALSISPDNPMFLANAGGIYVQIQDYKLAINFSLKALSVESQNAIALANLGAAYYGLGNYSKALAATLQSIKLDPNNQQTLTTAAAIYLKINDPWLAHKSIIEALKLDSSSSKLYTALGYIQQALGQLEKGKSFFRKALSLNNQEVEALFSLTNNISSSEEARQLIQIANTIKHTSLTQTETTFWHYAQANCYHKLKNYSLSERYLREAHKTKSSIAASEAESLIEDIEFFSNYKEKSTKSNLQKCSRIFIVGMPRSGSTLLESILSTNPGISDLGEVDAMNLAVMKYIQSRESIHSLEQLYQELLPKKEKKKFTIDKMLYNFRFSGLIAANIPNARIIHCRRHPLDNILSMLRSNLTNGNNYTTRPEDCAKVLLAQEKAMQKYKHKFNLQINTFNYDLFVANPQQELRPLLEWLELDWNESYLHPESNKRPICTASVVQARQPISKDSLGGWKHYTSLLEPAMKLIRTSGHFIDYQLW